MNYQQWLKSVPPEMLGDPLWTVEAYRLALFTAEIGWSDVTKLLQDKRTLDVSNQLFRAIGSISANISEGFSRSSGKDCVRFYEYALGSARESRSWYLVGRRVLPDQVLTHRLQMLTQIIRLLLVMIPDQRGVTIRDEEVSYHVQLENLGTSDLSDLLTNVPIS